MFSREQFGQRLKELRKAKGETQSELGEVLGVYKTQISEVEKGS